MPKSLENPIKLNCSKDIVNNCYRKFALANMKSIRVIWLDVTYKSTSLKWFQSCWVFGVFFQSTQIQKIEHYTAFLLFTTDFVPIKTHGPKC